MDTIKQNDTLPYLAFEFVDASGNEFNCSGFTITFVVVDRANNLVIESELNDTSGAVWIDQTKGTGEYQWEETDTAEAGYYDYKFEVVRDSDGRKFTLPNKGFYTYYVDPEI